MVLLKHTFVLYTTQWLFHLLFKLTWYRAMIVGQNNQGGSCAGSDEYQPLNTDPLPNDDTSTVEYNEFSPLLRSEEDETPDKANDEILNKIDFDRYFVIFSFIGLLAEAASSIFNLVSTQVFIPTSTKHAVATAFYALCILIAISMIVSSILAIKKSLNQKKHLDDMPTDASNEECVEENAKYKKLKKIQAHAQVSENALTIISQVMWLIVYIASLVMISMGDNQILENMSLFLSITASLLGIISCVIRLIDANISRKTSGSEEEKKQHLSFTIFCGIILAFEIIHCACHISEAIFLGGKMHNLYDFQNIPILCFELITVAMFIASFFIEQCIKSKGGKHQTNDDGVAAAACCGANLRPSSLLADDSGNSIARLIVSQELSA